MNTKLIIVTDLGLLRAYRQVHGLHDRQPRLELLEEMKLEQAREKLSDQVTDQAGRFPRGSGAGNIPGDLSAGESLNSEAERDRRLISQLAQRINVLLADPAVAACSLAASAPIHKQLLAAMETKARSKIGRVLALNLAKVGPNELPAYFAKGVS